MPNTTARVPQQGADLTQPQQSGAGDGHPPTDALPHEQVRFAHNSERQFAKLLDFYGIEWEYEPVEFVLERSATGLPTLAFRPDFFLPEYDTYIEITTLNQKLVTKKNRKIRLLRQAYPEIKIRILYQRDYLALLIKYGLEPPSQMAPELLAQAQPLSMFEEPLGRGESA